MRTDFWRQLSYTLFVVVLALSGAAIPAFGQASRYQPLRASMHIHSTYSTGDESLREIAEKARRLGIDVLVVTDDDLLQISYGLQPWQRLLRRSESYRSLLVDDTLEEYLSEIRRLDAGFEDLIIIEGVESAPYYTWDVDWTARRWTVRGWNRHLLAVGLDDASAYRSLPALGSEGVLLPKDGYSILRMLWPVLGLFYASWLGRRMHGNGLRLLIGCICLLFLLDTSLNDFRAPRFSPYNDAGAEPYQAWIDAVAAKGGLTFWSHPEGASTIPPRDIAGLAHVVSQSPAHAEDLLQTNSYTGFAALYADHITATEPGQQWDQALVEYLRGDRGRPPWGTGEIDYHRGQPGARLHDIQTVLWVAERSRRGVLEALNRGRAYAVRGGDEALQLNRWMIETQGGEAVSGQMVVSGQASWRVLADVDKLNGAAEEVSLRLVRGDRAGRIEIVADISGSTPLRVEHLEGGQAPEGGYYYRLLIDSRTSKLTSNPIFVRSEE